MITAALLLGAQSLKGAMQAPRNAQTRNAQSPRKATGLPPNWHDLTPEEQTEYMRLQALFRNPAF
jgi:hypothetical protein